MRANCRPRIVRTGRCLRITWPNRASVQFALSGGDVLGIRDVRMGGLALRSPGKLWRPLIATPDGLHYFRFVFDGARAAADGTVTVRATAVGKTIGVQEQQDEYLGDVINLALPDAEVHDRFEWDLKPSALGLGDGSFEGFSYRYRFHSAAGRRIYRLFDDASWEIGGHVDGNTLLLQGQVNPPVTDLRRSGYFTTACNYYGAALQGLMGPPDRVSFQRLPRIGTLQAFDFMVHARGALFGYFDPLVEVLSVVQKGIGEDCLHVLDELRRPLGASFESHPKHILFRAAPKAWSREDRRNLWTRAYDFVHQGIRRRYGVKPSPVLPRVWIPQYAGEAFCLGGRVYRREDSLYALAERALERWAEMGVKEICTHSLWHSDYTADRLKRKDEVGGMHGALVVGSICNVRVHEIAPLWGGTEGLAHFVNKAHALGMQVQLWWATHMSRRAPIFAERPDFMLEARDGLPNGGGFGHQTIITLDLNNRECFDWLFGKLKTLHGQTRFDGLFHDSYGNMTFLPMNYRDTLLRGQQEAYGRLVRRLQGIGIRTFTVEGIGPLGVGHFGIGLAADVSRARGRYQHALDWWIGNEDMVYGLNFAIGAEPWAGDAPSARECSFRCMAAGGRIGFTRRQDGIETWRGWLREHNRILARIAPLAGRRTLLATDRGILWDQPDGDQILFAYRAFGHPLPAGSVAQRVGPNGVRPIRTAGHVLTTRPWAVYRLTAGG